MENTSPLEDWSQTTITVSPDVIFQDLDGETVLLEMKSGHYFGLDEVSTRIWQLLTSGRSLHAVLTQLMDEYDVEEQQCRQDISAFLLELEKKHLITVHGFGSGTV